MKITIHIPSRVPVAAYGGTERVMWGLARALAERGHSVTLLAPEGSGPCPFADIAPIRDDRPLEQQLPDGTDIVHFNNYAPDPASGVPHVTTYHGNRNYGQKTYNAIFVSENHALRHEVRTWVYNGLDWDSYPEPRLTLPRAGAAFLGKAAWSVKNVRGAIEAARRTGMTLEVMGGSRLNLKMGVRFTPWPGIHFHGMVDDRQKAELLERAQVLLFPAIWDEPFGLAVIEAMYYGAPVIGSFHGSLPELITPETGAVCGSLDDLCRELAGSQGRWDPEACHEHAASHFSARAMADDYEACYARVLDGQTLNAGLPREAPMLRYFDFNY